MPSTTQSDKEPSMTNPGSTKPRDDAHRETTMAGVDDDTRMDSDVIHSTSIHEIPPEESRTAPGVTGSGSPASSYGNDSLPERSPSLVFSPLVLNPTMYIPPTSPKPREPQDQFQKLDLEKDRVKPGRTENRPSIIGRRFTYPDTYQEAVWLLDSVGTTREKECLLDHLGVDSSERRRSDTAEDVETDGVV